MSSEVTVPTIVDVIGYLRAYLSRRDFLAREAVLYKFDGHFMLRLLQDVESQSVELMQQRVAQVLAALELGYMCDGPTLLQKSAAAIGWMPTETIRLVIHIPGMLHEVQRYRELLKPPKQ